MFRYGYGGFFDPTMIIIIIPFIISIIAQAKVSSTFNKYSKMMSSTGLTGQQVANKILANAGVVGVSVLSTNTNSLGDHYNPTSKVIKLSNNVYDSSSVAAIGVAAHECGHAIQDSEDYFPNKLRSFIVPLANLGSKAAIPLFFVGIFFEFLGLTYLGIAFFALSTLFYLVTLPVEFDASARAIEILKDIIPQQEVSGAKSVLSAAAMTYVAAALTSIAQLARLILIARRND